MNVLLKANQKISLKPVTGMIIPIKTTNKLSVVKAVSSGAQPQSPGVQQREYFNTLFARCTEGYIEYRPLPSEGDQQWVHVSNKTVPKLPVYKNLFIGVATREEGYGDDAHVIEIPTVWVDVDFNDRMTEKEAWNRLQAFQLKPSIHVHSGGGWHLYWLLEKPATFQDSERIVNINKRIAEYFGGDTKSTNVSRVLRLPGTNNYKPKYGTPRPVRLLTSDQSKTYNMGDFGFLPAPSTVIPQRSLATLTSTFQGVREGQRHETMLGLAGQLFARKVPLVDVISILRLWNEKNDPPETDKELVSTIQDVYARYHQKNGIASLDRSTGLIPDLRETIRRSIIDCNKFATMKLPEKKFILKPWLATGTVTLVSAKKGVGKTWFALLICLAVTRKLSIGKWQTDNPTGCLYIDGEMAAQSLQKRMLGLLKKNKKGQAPFAFLSADLMKSQRDPSPYLQNVQWREEIRNLLIEDERYRVLILDNIASLTPGNDENLKKEWDTLNQWLLDLRSLGIAVIMIHHEGKKDSGPRGTSAMEDNIDASIKLTSPKNYKAEDGAKFNVEFTKNREFYGEDAESFCLQIEETTQTGITWKAESVKQIDRKRIIEMLKLGVAQKDIAEEVGCTQAYVSIVNKEASAAGLIGSPSKLRKKPQKKKGSGKKEIPVQVVEKQGDVPDSEGISTGQENK